MPFNGSGTFTRVYSWVSDAAAGIKIRADRHDGEDDGFAAGLSTCITKNGQTTVTADIPWNNHRLTSVADPVSPQDAATKHYADNLSNFSTGITLPGSSTLGRVKFTGTTEPVGLEFLKSNISFGVTSSQWIWNNKADMTGANVMQLTLGGDLTQTAIDSGATAGPVHVLYRDSQSPAVSDLLGFLSFQGKNSAATVKEYAGIYAVITDPTSGSEDGQLIFRNTVSGVPTTALTVSPGSIATAGAFFIGGGLTVSGDIVRGGGVPFVVGVNGAPIYLRPNGVGSGTGQLAISNDGSVEVAGQPLTVGGAHNTSGSAIGLSLVSGSIRTSANTTGAFSHAIFYNPAGLVGSINTSGSATAYATSSDERLKDFIGLYDPEKAIAIIRADPVRDFTWKSDGSYAVGWGAQTSYEISPDLASPGSGEPGEDDFRPWGVDQGKRTPYLWAALAAALDKIDALEARLAALEAK